MKNYLHNSGVIYFVVRIHKTEPSKRKIYYTTLTPVKLAHYLDGIENQKTKTIRLKEFPTDKNKKTAIVANFLKDSRRQASHVETGFISLDEVMKNKVPYIPHIDVLGYNSGDRNDSFSAVFENETYMYVSVEGSNTLIPIDTPLTINDITETIEETVSIDDNIYYDRYKEKLQKVVYHSLSAMRGILEVGFKNGMVRYAVIKKHRNGGAYHIPDQFKVDTEQKCVFTEEIKVHGDNKTLSLGDLRIKTNRRTYDEYFDEWLTEDYRIPVTD